MNISGLVGIFRGSLTVTLVGGLDGSLIGTVVWMVDGSINWIVEDDACRAMRWSEILKLHIW